MSKISANLNTLLAVSEGVSRDKIRPLLTRLHFKNDYVEATDGFMLIRASLHEKVEKECLFSPEAVKRVVSAEIKLKKKMRGIRPLAEIEGNTISVFGGSVTEVESLDEEEATRFPDTQKIIPKDDDTQVVINLNQKFLARVSRACDKLGITYVTVKVPKTPHQPVVIEGKEYRGDAEVKLMAVIMPVNL